MPAAYDALIFDCDGVLLNSEELCQQVELTLLGARGVHYTREELVHQYAGTTEREYRELLRADALRRFAVDLAAEFFDEMNAAITAAYRARLAAIPGAAAAAAGWQKRKAVASSSSQATLLLNLQMAGLAALFGEHIYSADTVGVGKPDPAIFAYTAAQLGVAPERCIVVEDSVHGVVAAKRASMTAIGFTGGGHCVADHAARLTANGADLVFGTHAELAAHLATLR
jgi:HAD superfamily hydrolase (TIGR01509 family)